MGKYPFIQAAKFRRGGNLGIDRLVVHTMEAPEKGETAESVAKYFANGSGGRNASAHYCIDNNSIVQCVRHEDTAYHAPPNRHSIGLEHAGYSKQNPSDWNDQFSLDMLHLSARLAAELCIEFSLPVVWLEPADLKAGKRGITSHNNVSIAFHQSDHTDPGPSFPVSAYIGWVRDEVAKIKGHTTPIVKPIDSRPVGGFVDGLYAVLLGRQSDVGGRSYWVNRLKTDLSRFDCAMIFARSPEYVDDIVDGLYRQFLNRAPEPDALTYWINRVLSGATIVEVVGSLVSSDEYRARYGSDAEWVDSLYKLMLGRGPDDGREYWVKRIPVEGYAGVAAGFYHGLEASGIRVGNLFTRIFQRGPDADGLKYWAAQMAATDDLVVAAKLISSEEFFASHQAP